MNIFPSASISGQVMFLLLRFHHTILVLYPLDLKSFIVSSFEEREPASNSMRDFFRDASVFSFAAPEKFSSFFARFPKKERPARAHFFHRRKRNSPETQFSPPNFFGRRSTLPSFFFFAQGKKQTRRKIIFLLPEKRTFPESVQKQPTFRSAAWDRF